MLTDLIELGRKMKDSQSEIKQNIQGINSDRKETRTQSNDLEQKEKETSNQNRMKKQEFKKVKRNLQTSGTTWNIPISEL